MTIRREWTFEHHFNNYIAYLKNNPESDHYWICQAQHDQALILLDAARDLHLKSVMISAEIEELRVRDLVLHGLGRRTRSIWIGFRKLYWGIAPDRATPLESDENTELSDTLNSIYINIRGALDLLAMSIKEKLFPQVALRDAAIGLYDNRWQKHLEPTELRSLLDAHSPWFFDMKERRDPAAHRIPLSFVPAILSSQDITRRNALVSRANGFSSKPFETDESMKELQDIFTQIEGLGKYLPLFTYDETFNPIPLYPTLTTDIAHCLAILDPGLVSLRSV